MKTENIIKKLSNDINTLYKEHNPESNENKITDILSKISTKSYELFKMGISLYYCENSKSKLKKLEFKSANKAWWIDSKEYFEELYYYLTTKNINIEIIENENTKIVNYKEKKPKYKYLSLFSGGLDSFIGALYLNQLKEEFILCHTITSNIMYGKAKKLYNYSKILHNHPFVNINSQFQGGSIEPSIPQTRSLLFILNAIPICDFYGINEIKVPENGPLMVNPPISEYAMPTKTTRPEFINTLNKIFKFFLEFPLKIDLPFKKYTKAEIIAAFKEDKNYLEKSYSCFNYRGRTKMCGKCYGCFVRKVSMAANSIIESNNYEVDVFKYQYFPKNMDDYDKYLIIEDLIKFCRKLIFKEVIDENIKDSVSNANIFDDTDLWEVLLRYAKDIFLGIKKYYEINKLDFNKYLIGKIYKNIDNIDKRADLETREKELNQFKFI